jgi:dihydroneopterin aldolase
MDKIFIHDLRVEARIGVYDWEKHLPQTVRLDLELAAPSSLPFQSGKIADALDYAKVVERLKAFAKDAPPPLLERFAEKVAQLMLDEFGTPWVRVRVAKLGALAAVREIGVEIERTSCK